VIKTRFEFRRNDGKSPEVNQSRPFGGTQTGKMNSSEFVFFFENFSATAGISYFWNLRHIFAKNFCFLTNLLTKSSIVCYKFRIRKKFGVVEADFFQKFKEFEFHKDFSPVELIKSRQNIFADGNF